MKTALDLYCGLGGWANGFLKEGWHVVGVDIADFSKDYPGEFVQADLLIWGGWRGIKADVVIASSPCEEFSRWDMPWTYAQKPPIPSTLLWRRAEHIAAWMRVPFINENVRGAQRFMGPSKAHFGPFHLWGNVPEILPRYDGHTKEKLSGKDRALRAKIPETLSRYLARFFKDFTVA